jgi:CRP-like cAMP-binding protein
MGPPRLARHTQVRLGDVDPDFLRLVSGDDRRQAGEWTLPAVDLPDGQFYLGTLLSQASGCCGIVISGVINRQVQINGKAALRVLGPGAVIPLFDVPSSTVIAASDWHAAGKVKLAIVGTQFVRACARWPQLQLNFIARFAEQNEQLATQLALCQLPRVEDRVLAMLWLLAESWGKVTPAGTVLPLHFTHEALGAMVGARRPTVTLALGVLGESGAVIQRDDGWLLLQPPPQRRGESTEVESPRLVDLAPTAWAADRLTVDRVREQRRELLEFIARLREEHHRSVTQLHERFRRTESVRNRAYEIRERVRAERRRANRRPATG